MFFLLKHTLIIYHTTCLNAILVNKAFKKIEEAASLGQTTLFMVK
jgi:hypothetical protein